MMVSIATSIACSVTVVRTRVEETRSGETRAVDTAVRIDAATRAIGSFTDALRNPQQSWLRFLFIDRTTDATRAGPSPEAVERGLRTAHAGCEEIYRRGAALTNTAADAVAIASRLSGTGRVTTTGTLTRVDGEWRYSAEPPDRLIVPSEGGGRLELTFRELRGDMSSVSAFFGGDHAFSFRAVERDRLDIAISTTRRSEQRTLTAEGNVVHGGTRFEVDLRITGTDRREVDATGNESETQLRARGTVRTPDFRLDVDETAELRSATADVRNGISARSAGSMVRRIDSTMVMGEDSYRWQGTRMQTSFRNGRPSQCDSYWLARGNVTRNGGAFASYRLVQSRDRLTVVLTLDDREVELQSFSSR